MRADRLVDRRSSASPAVEHAQENLAALDLLFRRGQAVMSSILPCRSGLIVLSVGE
jgi:hypothetical protein